MCYSAFLKEHVHVYKLEQSFFETRQAFFQAVCLEDMKYSSKMEQYGAVFILVKRSLSQCWSMLPHPFELPHAPDQWCCARCAYCCRLGSLALLMEVFLVQRGPVLFGQRAPTVADWFAEGVHAWFQVNLLGTSKPTMPLSDKNRVFFHPCERLG